MATLFVVEDLAAPSVLHRGGHAMFVVQMLRGLARLGHRVVFVEFVENEPTPEAIEWFKFVIARHWSLEDAALIVEGAGRSVAGLRSSAIERIAEDAAATITIAAHYRREPWPLIGAVRPRILFEQDPGYTHLWAAESDPLDIFGEHDVYFTVGANIGSDRCRVPVGALDWMPLWNPVVLGAWSARPLDPLARFTTIAGMHDYGWLEFEGNVLGPKVEEFHRFGALPGRAGETIDVVCELDARDDDGRSLEEMGWHVRPTSLVSTPDDFAQFIGASFGEFSVAKGGYVGTHCGWFSDRSACYLAAGRPVVLQATGFEDLLPTGDGLFAVRDVEEAAAAIAEIRRDPGHHSAAARALAAEHFDSDRILGRLLSASGIS